MLQNLTTRLAKTIKTLSGNARLTESNIQDALREVRIALLEADVALPVVRSFIASIQEEAIGQTVIDRVAPGQALVKIVQDELTNLLGKKNSELNLKVTPPAIILLAGLQGSGKTTTAAKLALFLKEQKKTVGMVSTDVYRPAAITQLQTLAKQIDVQFLESNVHEKPVIIAERAIDLAKKQCLDVLIVDTAGRLHIDEEMMAEIKAVHRIIEPIETLFVLDGMAGQDAAVVAKHFSEALPITGIILTKLDGDARGGAALSVVELTKAPIKFLGLGEKVQALETFHPEGFASRILGMGDIVSLVKEAERRFDKNTTSNASQKLKQGKSFDLSDYANQIKQMKSMGGIQTLMAKMPGAHSMPSNTAHADEQHFKKTEAIIQSMTILERQKPEIIRGSRKRRIAKGSGTQIQEVNRLLKEFDQMQKMFKKFKNGGMQKMMRNFGMSNKSKKTETQ